MRRRRATGFAPCHVGTLLEVNGRGYWETSDENIQQLQELYQEVEDRIEGVTSQG